MDLFDKCEKFIRAKEVQDAGVYPYFVPVSSSEDTEVLIDGRRVLMLGSNNYLGLTTHPKVKEAARKALERYGTGSCGSRFLNGTLDLHVELERKLADFLGMESALVFSTGFQTNLGAISTLVGRKDCVILDKWDHASIVDAARLSHGHVLRFKHNDMEDLDRVLEKAPEELGKLIVIDGIFSMEGDIVDLPGIVSVAKGRNVRIMLDDAHAVGVLGENGSGTASHFGLKGEVDLVMGTFSKSFASLGGYVAGREDVISYIKHHARSLIFSASMPPSVVATVEASLEIMKTEPERRARLWKNSEKMLDGLRAMGYDTGESNTPVIPIVVGDDMKTFMMWKALFDQGVFVNPVISPAVPNGRQLLRTSYMATHSEDQLDRALETFEKVGRGMGVLA
jgi:8-amino-7-oxononanoate synthase